MLCMIYLLCALVTSGFRGKKGREAPSSGGQLKEYLTFIKQQCLPVGILLIAMVVVIVVGQIVSMPIFRAGAYRDPAHRGERGVHPGHQSDLLQ